MKLGSLGLAVTVLESCAPKITQISPSETASPTETAAATLAAETYPPSTATPTISASSTLPRFISPPNLTPFMPETAPADPPPAFTGESASPKKSVVQTAAYYNALRIAYWHLAAEWNGGKLPEIHNALGEAEARQLLDQFGEQHSIRVFQVSNGKPGEALRVMTAAGFLDENQRWRVIWFGSRNTPFPRPDAYAEDMDVYEVVLPEGTRPAFQFSEDDIVYLYAVVDHLENGGTTAFQAYSFVPQAADMALGSAAGSAKGFKKVDNAEPRIQLPAYLARKEMEKAGTDVPVRYAEETIGKRRVQYAIIGGRRLYVLDTFELIRKPYISEMAKHPRADIWWPCVDPKNNPALVEIPAQQWDAEVALSSAWEHTYVIIPEWEKRESKQVINANFVHIYRSTEAEMFMDMKIYYYITDDTNAIRMIVTRDSTYKPLAFVLSDILMPGSDFADEDPNIREATANLRQAAPPIQLWCQIQTRDTFNRSNPSGLRSFPVFVRFYKGGKDIINTPINDPLRTRALETITKEEMELSPYRRYIIYGYLIRSVAQKIYFDQCPGNFNLDWNQDGAMRAGMPGATNDWLIKGLDALIDQALDYYFKGLGADPGYMPGKSINIILGDIGDQPTDYYGDIRIVPVDDTWIKIFPAVDEDTFNYFIDSDPKNDSFAQYFATWDCVFALQNMVKTQYNPGIIDSKEDNEVKRVGGAKKADGTSKITRGLRCLSYTNSTSWLYANALTYRKS